MFLKEHNLIDYSLLLVIEYQKGMSEKDAESQINNTLVGTPEFQFGSMVAFNRQTESTNKEPEVVNNH